MWSLFADVYMFSWMSLICGVIWTGETGGGTHPTSTGPPALPVLPALEEAARTTFATKVWRKWVGFVCVWGEGGRWTQWPFFSRVFVILLKDDSSGPPQEEIEENNFIEPEAPRSPQKPWSRPSPPTQAPVKPPTETVVLQKNEVVNTQQMCKLPFLLFILDLVSSKIGWWRIRLRTGRCTCSHRDLEQKKNKVL